MTAQGKIFMMLAKEGSQLQIDALSMTPENFKLLYKETILQVKELEDLMQVIFLLRECIGGTDEPATALKELIWPICVEIG